MEIGQDSANYVGENIFSRRALIICPTISVILEARSINELRQIGGAWCGIVIYSSSTTYKERVGQKFGFAITWVIGR